MDEGKVLLKSVSTELLQKVQRDPGGDRQREWGGCYGTLRACVAVGGQGGVECRAWGERSALIRAAAQVRAAGAVVAPYLTYVGCAMRLCARGSCSLLRSCEGRGYGLDGREERAFHAQARNASNSPHIQHHSPTPDICAPSCAELVFCFWTFRTQPRAGTAQASAGSEEADVQRCV